ncbi:hypothetical protein Raf01_26350 [Rugosimonospora africana]|uniref:ABC3 transporter permease C-terminal domain-containing protein n=1 Tax=Rugosimonospora africana TaxID=556532 RepID=A0A8J3QP08_9ACTN|nr:hypothetical protein Raf01_26350 [Rugosimonospora africana]
MLRLAVTGTRTDVTRILLTAFGAVLATLALLSAATVLSIPNPHQTVSPEVVAYAPYTNALLRESGLRPGLAFALVVLTIPALLFVGQCARLGAPARDRRLAAIRLAGATPRQGLVVAAAESGVAMALGTVVGLLVYLAGRRLIDAPNARGLRPLPTDVLPDWRVIAALVIGLPVLSALVTAGLLHRVVVTPLGVVRRVRTESPRPLPGLLIVFGVVLFALIAPAERYAGRHEIALPFWVLPLVVFLGGLSATIGVVTGAGWISYTVGRLLARYARRPAGLIAARRLQADPWQGSRALAALLAAVLLAAGTAWIASWYRTQARDEVLNDHLQHLAFHEPDSAYQPDPFYERAVHLAGYGALVAALIAAAGLAVAVANSVVERRRSLASLTASGVPRGVLSRAIVWQTMVVAVPAIAVAIATGVALSIGYAQPTVREGGSTYSCSAPPENPHACESADPESQGATVVRVPTVAMRVPVPWRDLGTIGVWGLGSAMVTAGLGLVFLRSSTAPEELRTT